MQRALTRWWQSRATPRDSFTLTQRNVYLLPTRSGWMLALTLIILLIASINYNLNLGYALTFLLLGAAAASMVKGHATLRGLTLQLQPPQPRFARQHSVLSLRLVNGRKTARQAIALRSTTSHDEVVVDVPAHGQQNTDLGFLADHRGWHDIAPIRIETRFPMGTFRIWAWWRPASQILVYPAPEPSPPALPDVLPSLDGHTRARIRHDEFDGIRPYRPGDPMSRMVWKKMAKTGEPVIREAAQQQLGKLWLDYSQTGQPTVELRLSRLTAWVLMADRHGLNYGLRLPGVELAPNHGVSHRERCLTILATW